MAPRAAMHQAGAAALSQFMRCDPPGPDQREISCPCGQRARYREMRSRRILTGVGQVELMRPWYLCQQCHHGQFPANIGFDIEGTDLSPGVRRMLALVGSEAPFDHGRRQIELLAGLEVTAKAVERTAEAIGGDIAGGEQEEIQRAVQLGSAMGQRRLPYPRSRFHHLHRRHRKCRRVWQTNLPGSVAARLEPRGKEGCPGDEAEWIWNNADLHFPGAIQIVDLYHARQHLWDVARGLHPGNDLNQKAWMKTHQKRLLDKGKIENWSWRSAR